MHRLLFRSLVLALTLSAAAIPAVAQSQDDGLATLDAQDAQTRLEPAYSLTKTGFGSADRVTDPGKIYVVRVEGLLARAVADHVTPTNKFSGDGKLAPPAKGFVASFGATGDVQQINPGDRFYVHEIQVKPDAVTFTLLSVNTVSTVVKGRSTNSRLRMYVQVPYAKGTAKTLTPAAVHQLTDPIFVPEGTPNALPTVQLGQSDADVRKIMGQPQKEVDLGAKKILVYKDLKVTLVDDKVTDAE